MSTNTPHRSLHNAAFVKSYMLQYISLMLIILTFVAAIFGRSPKDAIPSHSEEQAVVTMSVPLKEVKNLSEITSQITLKRAFKNERIVENDELSAISNVLLSHDLSLHCEVYAHDEFALSKAIHRAKALHEYFYGQGVPESSLGIFATTNVNGDDRSEGSCTLREL